VRTLQRQLDEADTSFTAMLGEVRRELAQRYVANPRYSLVRVSELLGYSTPSSFTRWFITQFGQAPQDWRKANSGST
jgi:AraC-like DNA-binding protein